MNRVLISSSFFSVVLGLCGLGSAWRAAVYLWHLPPLIGEAVMMAATLVWSLLLLYGLWVAFEQRHHFMEQLRLPIAAGTMALPGVATLLMVQAMKPWSLSLAWAVLAVGLIWHVSFAVWHTGALWQGGHSAEQLNPTLYLPTVAGNLTAAGALGAMGQTDWAWLFLGAGICSWLALEPLILRRLWHEKVMPSAQRPTLGIQFAPPAVAAAAIFVIDPSTPAPLLCMLVGYAVFQSLSGLRIARWSLSEGFAPAWWSWTFGLASVTTASIKLSALSIGPAQLLALPLFVIANLFIGWLFIRTLLWLYHAFKRPLALVIPVGLPKS